MIHKVNTGWLRSVMGTSIGLTFADAWATIINALEGGWGTVVAETIGNVAIEYTVIKGKYTGTLDTDTLDSELTGVVTVKLPYESTGISKVLVEDITDELVTNSITYIINNNTSIEITLNSGRKLITVSGTARRI